MTGGFLRQLPVGRQDHRKRFVEICPRFFERRALRVRAGQFFDKANVLFRHVTKNGGELNVHDTMIRLGEHEAEQAMEPTPYDAHLWTVETIGQGVGWQVQSLDEALSQLRAGGMYVIDDLLPQPNWPEGHAPKVSVLIDDIERRGEFVTVRLAWASGLMLVVRKGG